MAEITGPVSPKYLTDYKNVINLEMRAHLLRNGQELIELKNFRKKLIGSDVIIDNDRVYMLVEAEMLRDILIDLFENEGVQLIFKTL